ncbi:MAG TPA: GNAT family N-acetyltransferase [Methanobacterium sp.]
MLDLRIRNVIEEDFLKIYEVGEYCSPMTNERKSIYHMFTKFFKQTSLVFEDNGEIKGFLLGFISQEDPEDSYIHLLCIKNDLRGQNLGSNLVDEFIKIVSSHGCRKVFLICKPSNKSAIRFYNKIGFLSLQSDETSKLDDVNVFKDYDGLNDDKIVFFKSI